MSSAHAALIPSSVVKNENVLSRSLKQLNMHAYFVFGEKHLSRVCNSLTATSQSYLFAMSYVKPNCDGDNHCRLSILALISNPDDDKIFPPEVNICL